MRKELQELNRLHDLSNGNLKELRKNIDSETMCQAREEMKHAIMDKEIAIERAQQGTKQDITLTKMNEMISIMESEELISRKSGFVIQKRDEDLYINNKKQPGEVNKRFKKYLGDSNVKVKGKGNELNISGDYYEYNVSE